MAKAHHRQPPQRGLGANRHGAPLSRSARRASGGPPTKAAVPPDLYAQALLEALGASILCGLSRLFRRRAR